ncbi:TlyA family RNA methyltransferase [Verminephrobacter eiseniae]|uniref:TlyA family RNA methyltransferase n=1 Tax=Verminephrobacter eiseniae TaxID=364317 RepID=UPI002237544B|nr:TlyA family RNA methyltransferase [Verminephrobacter eiseniae]MCW5235059.1 TlyA family RNA methyltransferase [Verminephrobacter eiseniae]
MRADVFLLESGHAATRSQAQRLIASGVHWRPSPLSPWQPVAKNGADIPPGAQLHLLGAAEARYLSRAGLKLEAALGALGLCVAARRCLDVGQSTGGFTDCLLQRGAAQVVGVDVGHGQLHPQLRADARVVCVEGLNARTLTAQSLPGPAGFDLVTADLSFISLTLVLPALVPLLAVDGDLLLLVKPQFELQPGQLGKGGIVRNAALYAVVERRIRGCCAHLALAVLAWCASPIRGGDGNREFFVHARRATR